MTSCYFTDVDVSSKQSFKSHIQFVPDLQEKGIGLDHELVGKCC